MTKGDPSSNEDVGILHHEILRAYGGSWVKPFIPGGWLRTEAGESAASALRYIIRSQLQDSDLVAVTTPTACLVPDLWSEALSEMDVIPLPVFLERPRGEIADSLRQKHGKLISAGQARWMVGEYLLQREEWKEFFGKAAKVQFPQELYLRETFERLAKEFEISWPVPLEEAWPSIDVEAMQIAMTVH